MKQILLATLAITALFLPLFASAATLQGLPKIWEPTSIAGPLVRCTGDIAGLNPNDAKLPVCENLCDLAFTIVYDIYTIMAFVIWIILPFSFIVGGIMYMLSGANPGLLTSAKSTLYGAVVGTIIVLCSYILIATFVQKTGIGNIGGFSGGSYDSSGNFIQGTPSTCSL